MYINSEVGSISLLELEGDPVTKKQGDFSLPINILIIDYSLPSIVEQPSSLTPYFLIHTPKISMFNYLNPNNPIATMFGPTALF